MHIDVLCMNVDPIALAYNYTSTINNGILAKCKLVDGTSKGDYEQLATAGFPCHSAF